MEELKKKYLQALNALSRLEEEIKAYDNLTSNDELIICRRTRNSLIQTYEFTYEIFWKTLHTFLRDKEGSQFENITPAQTFRTAMRAEIISQEEFYTLTQLSTDRNKTSHAYVEALAVAIAERIPAHYQVMKKILERIKI